MFVTFNVNGNLIITPYDTAVKSEFIKNLLVDIGIDNTHVYIPDKYYDVIDNVTTCKPHLQNYISFLNYGVSQDVNLTSSQDVNQTLNQDTNEHVDNSVKHNTSNVVNSSNIGLDIIQNKELLRLCFDVYSYFLDMNYFRYLLKQLFDNWSCVGDIICGQDCVNPDLQREILLYCPYDMLPQHYIDDKCFFNLWLNNNRNKTIIINGNSNGGSCQMYHNDFVISELIAIRDENSNNDDDLCYHSGSTLTLYHTVDGQECGFKKMFTYYLGDNSLYECEYFDRIQHGIWKQWSKSGRLSLCGEYQHGNKTGVWTTWCERYRQDDNNITNNDSTNGNDDDNSHYDYVVLCTCTYVDGKKHGWERRWHVNEGCVNYALAYEIEYRNDMKHGMCTYWHNNEQHTIKEECQYINNVHHGLRKVWYDDEQHTLKQQVIYINGKSAIDTKYHINGQPDTDMLIHYMEGREL